MFYSSLFGTTKLLVKNFVFMRYIYLWKPILFCANVHVLVYVLLFLSVSVCLFGSLFLCVSVCMGMFEYGHMWRWEGNFQELEQDLGEIQGLN